MPIHFAPGCRLHFSFVVDVVYVLLRGGSKRGQQRDIGKAQEILTN
jgi:putative addiction module killer protein